MIEVQFCTSFYLSFYMNIKTQLKRDVNYFLIIFEYASSKPSSHSDNGAPSHPALQQRIKYCSAQDSTVVSDELKCPFIIQKYLYASLCGISIFTKYANR